MLRGMAGEKGKYPQSIGANKSGSKGYFQHSPSARRRWDRGSARRARGLSLQNITCYFPTPLFVAIAPLSLPYILRRKNTPQCCGTRQGRRLECFVLLRRKLQKLRNVLYSSSAHECAIGEVSVRTEGMKTPSYQSVYTGHIPFSPAMSRSITENGVSYIWERIYKNNPH